MECCVLEGGVEVVWVSLNQALVEGARAGQGEKAEGKKRKRKSGAKQAVVSGTSQLPFRLAHPSVQPCASLFAAAAHDGFCGGRCGENYTPLPHGRNSNPGRLPAGLCCDGLCKQ